MERSSSDAAVKDAQTKLGKEECAGDMGQKSRLSYAAKRDAKISPK
jgi:hypothetical protein